MVVHKIKKSSLRNPEWSDAQKMLSNSIALLDSDYIWKVKILTLCHSQKLLCIFVFKFTGNFPEHLIFIKKIRYWLIGSWLLIWQLITLPFTSHQLLNPGPGLFNQFARLYSLWLKMICRLRFPEIIIFDFEEIFIGGIIIIFDLAI